MNSPFANIFLAIQAKLQTLVDTNNVRLINFIDQDMQQLMYHVRPAVAYPAVLIDFRRWKFENMGEDTQTATGDVEISVIFAPYSSTSDSTPETYKEKALQYYEVEQAVHLALHGWTPTLSGQTNAISGMGMLTRVDTDSDIRRPDYRVRKIVYRLVFEDYSTQLPYNKVLATPVFTPQII